jgi:hypothetical protein
MKNMISEVDLLGKHIQHGLIINYKISIMSYLYGTTIGLEIHENKYEKHVHKGQYSWETYIT